MTELRKTKIISLEPVPGTTDDSGLMWLPVTQLVAVNGNERITYRMPYPHSGNAVDIDKNGAIAVMVDNRTIKIIGNQLVGNKQPSVLKHGGLSLNDKYELFVTVDAATIDIDENGRLFSKAPIVTGQGIERIDGRYSVDLCDDGGMTFDNHGIAIKTGTNGSLKFSEDGQLEIKIANDCAVALNDSGEMAFMFDSESFVIKDGKLAVNSLGQAAKLNIAGYDAVESHDTVWTSKTADGKITDAIKWVSENYNLVSEYARCITKSKLKISSLDKWINVPLMSEIDSKSITVLDNAIHIDEHIKFAMVNARLNIYSEDYLNNSYESTIKVRLESINGTKLVNTERIYIIDTTKKVNTIYFNMSLPVTETSVIGLQIWRGRGDKYENKIDMSCQTWINVTGVCAKYPE